MHIQTAAQLLALNRQFYQTFALQFSATRQRIQPGVRRILKSVPEQAVILDMGCGNGELARELERREHKGSYIGLDFSPELLAVAKSTPFETQNTRFIYVDITVPDWPEQINWVPSKHSGTSDQARAFHPDFVFAFAVLHHIPGDRLRRQLVAQIRGLLLPGGQFVLSVWQFLNSERLRGRIQSWERLAIHAEDIDKGDYLIDWRAGGSGLRYVHNFTQEELELLAQESGYSVQETFYSDGESNNLGLYQTWIPTSQV